MPATEVSDLMVFQDTDNTDFPKMEPYTHQQILETLTMELGVTRQTIFALEKKYAPSLQRAFRISRYFKQRLKIFFSLIPNNLDIESALQF